jgi:hypothetical protein
MYYITIKTFHIVILVFYYLNLVELNLKAIHVRIEHGEPCRKATYKVSSSLYLY